MNVVMLNPPFVPRFSRSQRSPGVTRSGTLYYPIWLAYATGVLEQAGFEVRLLDAAARNWDVEHTLEVVASTQPDLMVVDTSTPSIYNDIEIAQRIKRRLPRSFVTLVGPHVSALPEETLSLAPLVDAAARGEYDYTLRDLAQALAAGDGPQRVAGLSYRSDATLVRNPDRPLISNLDDIPFVSQVYLKHLRLTDYRYAIAPGPTIPIVTGRGCPYQCSFCVYPQVVHGHRYRQRSIASILDEFRFIARQIPAAAGVFFEDDTFTQDRQRCLAFCDALIQEGLTIPWTANARPDVDYETLVKMRRAGCRLLCVGFESGDQALLHSLRKGTQLDEMRRFARDVKQAGILIHGCFIFGAPGETKETMQSTLRLAHQLELDTVQFYPLMVYPGTEAFHWATEKGFLIAKDYSQWLSPDGTHRGVVGQPGCSVEDTMRFADAARRSFYLRPNYLVRKLVQALAHPAEGARSIRALGRFVPFLLKQSPHDVEK